MCHKINLQLQGVHVGMRLMQNLIKPIVFNNETWGESVKHLKILDV
jgi:hypothetical protein